MIPNTSKTGALCQHCTLHIGRSCWLVALEDACDQSKCNSIVVAANAAAERAAEHCL